MADNKIRKYREKLGLTREQLGEKTWYSLDKIEAWETGEKVPTVYAAICLAQALGTTVEELFAL